MAAAEERCKTEEAERVVKVGKIEQLESGVKALESELNLLSQQSAMKVGNRVVSR